MLVYGMLFYIHWLNIILNRQIIPITNFTHFW